MSKFWNMAHDLIKMPEASMTPRLWMEAARQNRESNYARFKGMTVDEIYNELLAQAAPLDAILKAVNSEE